ncbi:MAG TPA: VOC family protein [Allosphingosinicella sp.]|nr:VOC family protein [Allosphingosinicella sp.]
MLPRTLLLLLTLLAPGPARAQVVAPWTEAVVSVRDLDGAASLLRKVGGWRETHRGRIDRAELRYFRLPRSASGAFLRICAPGSDEGCIRFVRFDGVPQRPVRLAARPWDTGGIFSLMMRSDNVQSVFDRAIALGWWAESEPIAFAFAGSQLRNVVLTGPHGINIALYERSSPPFTAFPLGPISRSFNSMRMVRDQRAAAAFYRGKLGYNIVFETDFLDPQPQSSNFSLPRNLTTSIVRRAAALHPTSGETGRVEVMQFVGFEGRDLSRHASPPNLGILSLRHPVSNLQAYRAQLRARGVVIAYEATAVRISGVGSADLIAVRDPDGNLTEFYQARRSASR